MREGWRAARLRCEQRLFASLSFVGLLASLLVDKSRDEEEAAGRDPLAHARKVRSAQEAHAEHEREACAGERVAHGGVCNAAQGPHAAAGRKLGAAQGDARRDVVARGGDGRARDSGAPVVNGGDLPAAARKVDRVAARARACALARSRAFAI